MNGYENGKADDDDEAQPHKRDNLTGIHRLKPSLVLLEGNAEIYLALFLDFRGEHLRGLHAIIKAINWHGAADDDLIAIAQRHRATCDLLMEGPEPEEDEDAPGAVQEPTVSTYHSYANSLVRSYGLRLGIDLGGTKMAAALVDSGGTLQGPVSSCPTPRP